jgi:hypothetical protein
MSKITEGICRVWEWVAQVHTVVWVGEVLGLSVAITTAFAAAQKVWRSHIDWIVIVAGFSAALLLLIANRFALGPRTRSGPVEASAAPLRPIDPKFENFFGGVEPASATSTLLGDLPASGRSSEDVVALFSALGIVRVSNERIQCVSAPAEAFLASLRAHLQDGNSNYFGDWSATETTERLRLSEMLGAWEEYRRRSQPEGKAQPSRNVNSALALIRADLDDNPRFILLDNPTWRRPAPLSPPGSGAATSAHTWWFVGGAQTPQDQNSMRTTVIRETCEELAHAPDKIREPQWRGKATERLVSKRVGLYTQFNYDVFALQLFEMSDELLWTKGYVQTFSRKEEYKWLTWDEILKSEFLNANAASVIGLLHGIDPFTIPKSADLRKR